jgi:hypothetical protein
MPDKLRSTSRRLDADERRAYKVHDDAHSHVVNRRGEPVVVRALDSLMEQARDHLRIDHWDDRAKSDRWLAPRIHYALRLFRAEAADRGIWQWIALRYPWYLEWRWADADGKVAEDRWWGPIHKQAFARLWWGAEIFRDGPDYRPVEQAFVFQDLPNSYLHRPLVRCRSLALAVVDRVANSSAPSADQVNSLARVLNLATVGTPPEVETGYQLDDLSAFQGWVRSSPPNVNDWTVLPGGPPATDTTESSREGGARIVSRGWGYAKLEAD